MKKLLTLLNIIFIQSGIYLIAKVVPKDKNLMVFGSSLGHHFADNTKYLYLYIHQLNGENSKKIVWITKNKDLDIYLKSINLPSEYLYSFKGILYTIRASKVFITHNVDDINGALIGGAEIIQLWHGCPLRKIGVHGEWFTTGFKGKLKVLFYSIFHFSYYMRCDKLIAFSDMEKIIFKEAFSFSFRDKKIEENILTLGQPRNDVLSQDYVFDKKIFPELEKLENYKIQYKKIISWLPTHRLQLNKTIIDIMDESNFDLVALDSFCKKNNILFVIKAHFLELHLVDHLIKNSTNIITYEIADPYPLLHFTDILITDYSSVFFDFLVTDKPIIFAPFDFDEYEKTSRFYYEYNNVTPGVKCNGWECIMNQLSLLTNNIDDYKGERKKFIDEIKLIKRDNCKIIYNYYL